MPIPNDIPQETIELMDRNIAILYQVIPLAKEDERPDGSFTLVIAMANPEKNGGNLANLVRLLDKQTIRAERASPEEISAAIKRYYSRDDDSDGGTLVFWREPVSPETGEGRVSRGDDDPSSDAEESVEQRVRRLEGRVAEILERLSRIEEMIGELNARTVDGIRFGSRP